MKDSAELFSELFALSFGFWMVYGLYITFRIKSFIVDRYEQETGLSRSKYFKELMPWTKYLPAISRSVFYSSHLWKFVWYWRKERFAREKKRGKINTYDDIRSPDEVTRHFTKKEIRSVNIYAVCCIVAIFHLIAYFAFKYFLPEAFS